MYLSVGMYFGKTMCFQIRYSSLAFQHQLYLVSICLASKGSWIWYGWGDFHDLTIYYLNILCMESVFSSMMNRWWIWTWFWSKEKSFIRCLTKCNNTLYIFSKCVSTWLIRFGFERACLSYHLYSLIFLCLVCCFSSSCLSCHLYSLIFLCLNSANFAENLLRCSCGCYSETGWDTMSGAWKRKVSRNCWPSFWCLSL